VVLLTCTIGILNICLGYALAVFLGYGPPGILEGWDVLMGVALAEPAELSVMDWTGVAAVESSGGPSQPD
jgi:hypothetical protein